MAKNEFFTRAKRLVEAQLKQQEDERRRTLLKKRTEFVTLGAKSLKANNTQAAIAAFRNYIHLLEESKGVRHDGLGQGDFDNKKELGDMLLLAGVYWELAKLFDRAKSDVGYKDFRTYLSKYVTFARGMSYQALCAESIRRYLNSGRATHSGDFRGAYKALGGTRCFVVTSLWDVIEPATLPALREFRDERLLASALGRGAVQIYYFTGPLAARVLDRMPQGFRGWSGGVLNRVARKVGNG